MKQLTIPRGDRPTLKRRAAVATIDQFLPNSSPVRSSQICRVAHDGRHIYLRFEVKDRYVRCLKRPFQGRVWMDSCVEFFVRPRPNKGYFNFEFNCGGQMLVYFIEDPRRDEHKRMRKFTKLTRPEVEPLNVTMNLKCPINPEIKKPTAWWLEVTIPLSVMEKYLGRLGTLSGQTWRANFQKCGNSISHPVWATWNNIGPIKNFHQPDKFGELSFE